MHIVAKLPLRRFETIVVTKKRFRERIMQRASQTRLDSFQRVLPVDANFIVSVDLFESAR